jgi:hypothetical protein
MCMWVVQRQRKDYERVVRCVVVVTWRVSREREQQAKRQQRREERGSGKHERAADETLRIAKQPSRPGGLQSDLSQKQALRCSAPTRQSIN